MRLSTIYKGILKNKVTFHVQQLTTNDVTNILGLQSIVYEDMPNKKYLSKLSKEEYEYILAGQGLILGTFVAEDLIAIRALLIPKLDDPEHLGYEVGLSQDQFPSLIYQEISFVHPDYRGNRLQQLLARLIMEQLDEQFPNVCYIS